MIDPAVLAIVGSTNFAPPDALAWRQANQIIRACLGWLHPTRVVSGGARGIDTLAEQIAQEYGHDEDAGTLTIHRPTVRRWAGPGGFQERNQRIADDCTHLLAIRCSQSTTYGSGWTADRAEERLGAGRVWRRILPLVEPETFSAHQPRP